MRLSTRMRLTVVVLLACLMMVAAFAVTASAHTVQPHLSARPSHIVTDITGCGTIILSGKGYTASTGTVTNYAFLKINDSPFFDEDASFGGSGTTTALVPVNAHGTFTARVTVCDPFVTAPDHWTISSRDNFTFLPSNSVNILVD